MNLEQLSLVAGGIAALAFGIHALVTRRVVVGEEGDDSQVWLYGWRAVAIGIVALLVSGLFFGSAFGLVHLANA